MNYRQWKKRYKKMHGVNPPLHLDKRKRRRLVKTFKSINFAAVARCLAKVLKNAAAFMMRMGETFSRDGMQGYSRK